MRLLLVLGVSALLLAACGGDDDETPAPGDGSNEATGAQKLLEASDDASGELDQSLAPEADIDPQGESGEHPDAAYYAEEHGITIEEAARRLDLQATLGATLVEIAQTAPDRVAGYWLEHEPEFGAVVWFTGGDEGLDEARALAAEAPGPIEIRTGAAHTEAELRRAQELLFPLALELGGEGVSGIWSDIMTGAVVVDVVEGSDIAADVDGFREKLAAETGVPVRVEVGQAVETLEAVEDDGGY